MKVLIRSIDLETAGMEPPASVLEIGWTDIEFDTDTKACEITKPASLLFKPKEDLTADNIAVHHLTPGMLAGYQPCEEKDLRLVTSAGQPQFLVAFNAEFEQRWFTPEISGSARWICPMKVARRVWLDAPGYSNQTLRYWLGLDLPDDLAMPPHRAAPDSFVTAHIMAALLRIERVSAMVGWTLAPRYYATCPLRKHKDKPWDQIPADYLSWMLSATDMEDDLKLSARSELDRRRNPQQTAPSGGTETAS